MTYAKKTHGSVIFTSKPFPIFATTTRHAEAGSTVVETLYYIHTSDAYKNVIG